MVYINEIRRIFNICIDYYCMIICIEYNLFPNQGPTRHNIQHTWQMTSTHIANDTQYTHNPISVHCPNNQFNAMHVDAHITKICNIYIHANCNILKQLRHVHTHEWLDKILDKWHRSRYRLTVINSIIYKIYLMHHIFFKGYKPKTVHSVRERTDWGP